MFGALPFHGTDTLSRLLALLVDEPLPLRERNVEVPAELADLVTQLLVKNAAYRFPSARGVVEAIEVIESTYGFTSRPTPPPGSLSLHGLDTGETFDLGDAGGFIDEEEPETAAGPEEATAPNSWTGWRSWRANSWATMRSGR